MSHFARISAATLLNQYIGYSTKAWNPPINWVSPERIALAHISADTLVSDRGEILNAIVTPGNIDDRKPIPDLLSKLFGKFFADRGYVSKELADKLFKEFGIEFFAKPRRNMKNHLMRLHDKLLSRKRSIIETINDQLKNISQIEHSRHRSPVNFCVNVLCGLIAYCHQPKKPSLQMD
ncbi:transposase (plasmid) [Calothrix sp. NIES-4101]|nr:transposase [Calothrix sp. NIES-4101]